MATYNGEKYIGEQLKSLVDQIHHPTELVVGDDGSTDETIKILEEFKTRAPFPVYIHRNEFNLGYARNFLVTAKRCTGDWIAFCDQDDVWLPNKLSETAKAIESAADACMVLQNAFLCDSALKLRETKFPRSLDTGIHGRGKQYGFWVWPGFLKTVSKDMIDLYLDEPLPKSWYPKEMELTHDKWTCVIANALGGITILGTPVCLYRRHEATVTGNYDRKSISERVAKSRGVTGDDYAFLAEVAVECANYMKNLAMRTDKPTWKSAFNDNAQEFYHLSEIQELRGKLYLAERFRERLNEFVKIMIKGGYVGQPFYAMGIRSALKDGLRVVVGPRI
jgi:glycosyltransferase involved in cell wall biosynthesis